MRYLKKLLLVFFLTFSIMIVSSCRGKEKVIEYNSGDVVEKDGVIYKYMTTSDYRKYQVFSKYDTQDKSYYSTYYYDMSDYASLPKIEALNYAEDWKSFRKYCSPTYSPTSAYVFPLSAFFNVTDGFIVTGYTSKLKKDVVIPETINGNHIWQIGYKAFQYAPMESFKWIRPGVSSPYDRIIHPFAFNYCPNLKEMECAYSLVTSMGISNNPQLDKVSSFECFMDCSLYDLPNLTSILNFSGDFPDYSIGSWWVNLDEIEININAGMKKSMFYKCPKLNEIVGSSLTTKDNTVYYNEDLPIYVFNNYNAILLDTSYYMDTCLMYNQDTLQAYIPMLNDGLAKTGTLIPNDRSIHFFEEEGKLYVNAHYPKEEDIFTPVNPVKNWETRKILIR